MKSLQRTYPATPETIWELWTTPEGIARWWAPDELDNPDDRRTPALRLTADYDRLPDRSRFRRARRACRFSFGMPDAATGTVAGNA